MMFDQLFADGFFHADPHPGNVFITPIPVEERAGTDAAARTWRFTFIDFGMMGEVPEGLRRGLRRLLIAAASRDGKGLVDGIRDVGVLLPNADTAELERAMTQLFARFGGMGFAELQEVDPREFRAFAIEFGDIVRSLPFQLPENFLLIIRAMSLTSGMSSTLDPKFNIWDAVEPYANRLIREESGNVVQAFAKEALSTLQVAARLPKRLDAFMLRVEDGRIAVQTPGLDRRVAALDRLGRRILSGVIFAALLIGGAVLRPDDLVFGSVLMGVSVLPLLHVLFGGILSGRR